ncbi:YeeE/YedE family protein [Niabella pedocola]|uniref:YeeE/YedE family protein n=1 Tax=Niabella pedocola TaxID=1752077 RepID=A0ABS8PLY6_9BACT|nr:YeeE/YedE thiosulfate transporter family protein [Niabella pedocola]MCD2422115.1 YeeE/YedE family protein [Niabella pedocola]
MIELIKHPWPWYVAGPLIGLTIPVLLLAGNKSFGISSSLRHICASCVPGKIPFFQYDWRKEAWNLFFVLGIFLGGTMALYLLSVPHSMEVHPELVRELAGYGIAGTEHPVPGALISWSSLFTLRGFIVMVGGGFLVGFGARYAGGCTSGHAIMGLSNRQWPSLMATIFFMAGGFIMANLILPFILKL